MLRLSVPLILSCFALSRASAQTLVSDDEAIAHRETYVAPLWPAGVTGSHDVVMVKVHIAKNGSVTSATAIKGLNALRAAAVAAVKQWHYRRFDEGAVVATIPVDFEEKVAPEWLKQDQAISVRYFQADDLCRKAIHSPEAQTAVRQCGEALAIAREFPDEASRHLEIMDAHELAGRALLQDQQLEKAEQEFDVAIALADKYLKPLNAEYAYPYMWRATVLQTQGKIPAALSDYEEGERSMRLAIANIDGLKQQYAATLRGTLQRHAALLRSQHEVGRAETLEKEQESLAVQFPSS